MRRPRLNIVRPISQDDEELEHPCDRTQVEPNQVPGERERLRKDGGGRRMSM